MRTSCPSWSAVVVRYTALGTEGRKSFGTGQPTSRETAWRHPEKQLGLECFADAHAECVTVHTLSDVGTEIDMILLTQFEP